MASRPNVDDLRSGRSSDLWKKYHEAQLRAFLTLLSGEPFGCLSCRSLLKKAKLNSQTLSSEDKAYVCEQLRIAIELRKLMLSEHPYKDQKVTNHHNLFIGVLDHIKSCLFPNTTYKLRNTTTDHQANIRAETTDISPRHLVSKRETHGQPENSEARKTESPIDKQPTPDRTESQKTVDEDAFTLSSIALTHQSMTYAKCLNSWPRES
jgi:hypothetical protein